MNLDLLFFRLTAVELAQNSIGYEWLILIDCGNLNRCLVEGGVVLGGGGFFLLGFCGTVFGFAKVGKSKYKCSV